MTVTQGAAALAPLLLLSLVLVNAQAVTAHDQRARRPALDLLLVTDLTPKEIVFGKLGGMFYNTKEMVLLPMVLCGCLWFGRRLEPGKRAVPAGRVGRALSVRGRAGHPRGHELRQFAHAPSPPAWGPCFFCSWAWPPA